MDDAKQIARVNTHELDVNVGGEEWEVHYALYENKDDDGRLFYELWQDDAHGNGVLVCTGTHRSRMLSLPLRLGEWMEWEPTPEDPAIMP